MSSSVGNRAMASPGNKDLPVKREIQELSLLFDIKPGAGSQPGPARGRGPDSTGPHDRMGMSRGTLTLLNRETGESYIEAAHGLSTSNAGEGSTPRRGRYRQGD